MKRGDRVRLTPAWLHELGVVTFEPNRFTGTVSQVDGDAAFVLMDDGSKHAIHIKNLQLTTSQPKETK